MKDGLCDCDLGLDFRDDDCDDEVGLPMVLMYFAQ